MITKKLFEFQKKEITLVKDTTNPFYNSKYATLNQVLEKVRKPLMDMNVLILQAPEKEGLRTTLLDLEDDTKVEALFPFTELTTAQKVGAGITYGRRYSLVALLGLEDEDDDGNTASDNTPVKPYNAPERTEAPQKVSALCAHGEPAVTRKTKKAGVNLNREFYTCGRPQKEQCQFFVWVDEYHAPETIGNDLPTITPDEYQNLSYADKMKMRKLSKSKPIDEFSEDEINAKLQAIADENR